MQGDNRRAPSWVTVLIMAEKWGVPPWEVGDAPGSLMWAARQNALDEAREWKRRLEEKMR